MKLGPVLWVRIRIWLDRELFACLDPDPSLNLRTRSGSNPYLDFNPIQNKNKTIEITQYLILKNLNNYVFNLLGCMEIY